MQMQRLQFQKGDLLAIGLVIVLAVLVILCFVPQQAAETGRAVINLNGQTVETVDLSQDRTIVIEGQYRNVIRIEDGAIAVVESDCPGQDCVHSGRIHNGSRILVCLPNGLEIRIVSAEEDVDFVVG